MLRLVLLLTLAALSACASPNPRDSSYNRGVQAYRAKDFVAARDHWAHAVEEGEISALNNLGYLLFMGLGGEKDETRAVGLWAKAASAGHSESQWHLGHAYEAGAGVERSLVRAYAWYRCAISSASKKASTDEAEAEILKDANASLSTLLERLPPEELPSAERLARELNPGCGRPPLSNRADG